MHLVRANRSISQKFLVEGLGEAFPSRRGLREILLNCTHIGITDQGIRQPFGITMGAVRKGRCVASAETGRRRAASGPA